MPKLWLLLPLLIIAQVNSYTGGVSASFEPEISSNDIVSWVIPVDHTVRNLTDSVGTVMDIDGNEYKTVKIGEQWWMAENLKVMHYRNGKVIPNVTEREEWGNLITGAYCNYDNDSSLCTTYGSLYNWYAVVDGRGIAPEGWHVPTDEEWKKLEIYLGMDKDIADKSGWRGNDEGGKLKMTGTKYWSSPNTGATNISGFSAIPSGGRASDIGYIGYFFYLHDLASFWSSSEYNGSHAWYRDLSYNRSNIYHEIFKKQNGFAVRCIKDNLSMNIEDNLHYLPNKFALEQNYPNPFNSTTKINYSIPKKSNVVIKIYDVLGKEITTLVNEEKLAGTYELTWNATNLPSGIYFYQLKASDFIDTKKMILMK